MVYSLGQFKVVLQGLGCCPKPIGVDNPDRHLLDDDTQAAIRAFQTQYNLPVTGAFDRTTQEKARQLVRNLQHSLNLAIDAQLPVNEFYGCRTAQAVSAFQQQHGLPPTGIAECAVRRKLDEEVKQKLRCRVASTMTLPPDDLQPA